jgi:hypothetical protein
LSLTAPRTAKKTARARVEFDLKESEFQGYAEVEPVTFDALGDVEVVNPARV